MTLHYYMYRGWQDCCRRGENRFWPSVSVESVDSEYWCLNSAIVYAFIMRLTVEERVLWSTFKLKILYVDSDDAARWIFKVNFYVKKLFFWDGIHKKNETAKNAKSCFLKISIFKNLFGSSANNDVVNKPYRINERVWFQITFRFFDQYILSKTKRNLLYLKPQSVPRCKHFSSRL